MTVMEYYCDRCMAAGASHPLRWDKMLVCFSVKEPGKDEAIETVGTLLEGQAVEEAEVEAEAEQVEPLPAGAKLTRVHTHRIR